MDAVLRRTISFKNLIDQTQFILDFKAFSWFFDANPGFQKSILLRLYIGNVSSFIYEDFELEKKVFWQFCSNFRVVFRNRACKIIFDFFDLKIIEKLKK